MEHITATQLKAEKGPCGLNTFPWMKLRWLNKFTRIKDC